MLVDFLTDPLFIIGVNPFMPLAHIITNFVIRVPQYFLPTF